MGDSAASTKKQKVAGQTTANTENQHCSNGTSEATNNPKDSIRNGSKSPIQPIMNGIAPNRDTIVCKDMCFYCFDVLNSHLSQSPLKDPAFSNEQFPLFVTWQIGERKQLRGCIGTFSAMNLHEGLREYAATSAFRDQRFSPIAHDELPRLYVSVSILCHFEDGKNYLDWNIGEHGIRIEFHTERGSRRTATYLPEVALEQGWNHVQTIDSLLRKGGYKGNITQDTRQSIKLQRYQSQKLTVSYQEYKDSQSIE